MRNTMKNALQNNRGFALAVTLMVVVLLLSITGVSLSLSRLELKKTSNHKLGTLDLELADAALQHVAADIGKGAHFLLGIGKTKIANPWIPIEKDFQRRRTQKLILKCRRPSPSICG